MKKRYCPYCGQLLDERCGCEREVAEAEAELIEELEERQLHTAWQQDLIDMHRYEQ